MKRHSLATRDGRHSKMKNNKRRGGWSYKPSVVGILLILRVASAIRPARQVCLIYVVRAPHAYSCFTNEILQWSFRVHGLRRILGRIWVICLNVMICNSGTFEHEGKFIVSNSGTNESTVPQCCTKLYNRLLQIHVKLTLLPISSSQ